MNTGTVSTEYALFEIVGISDKFPQAIYLKNMAAISVGRIDISNSG